MFAARSLLAVRSFWASLRGASLPRGDLARALKAIEAGRPDEAQDAFLAALEAARGERQRAVIHNKRGVAFVTAGDTSEAVAAFAAALTCDPVCAPALTNIGNLLLEDGHLEDAIDYFDAAILADDGYPLAYRNLGIALRRAGRRSASVRALRKADRLEVRPRRARA